MVIWKIERVKPEHEVVRRFSRLRDAKTAFYALNLKVGEAFELVRSETVSRLGPAARTSVLYRSKQRVEW